MKTIGYGMTDVGKVRQRNEDAWLVDNELGLFVVCDGMGGHAAGEVAAALAVETLADEIRAHLDALVAARKGRGALERVRALVESAIHRASEKVYDEATSDRSKAGMGCTLTCLVVAGSHAVVGHVGDTRLYMVRDGRVHRLTRDHTVAAELARSGIITAAQARNHPFSSTLSRSIGAHDAVQVDTLVIDVLLGDRFLLCSDGLTRYLDEDTRLSKPMEAVDLAQIPRQLLSLANQAGGEDNITAIVTESFAELPERVRLQEQRTSHQRRQEALEKVYLFESMPLVRVSRILDACSEEFYEDGEEIVGQGQPNDSMWVVVDGDVSVVRDGTKVGKLTAGTHVGSDTLFRRRLARSSLVADGAVRLVRLTREAFLGLVRTRPQLGVALMGRLGRRLGRENERLVRQLAGEPEEPAPSTGSLPF